MPPSSAVLVIRGSGIERNDSRRPLPDGATPKCFALSRSCMYATRTPFSISVLCWPA